MVFRTLHWNSLIFVSCDTLNESEYISFQSNWTDHEIDPETSFEQMEAFFSPF